MKNIKKTVLFFAVGLVLLTPITAAVFPFLSKASADTTADASVATNAAVWVMARSVLSCLYKHDVFSPTTSDKAADGKWFMDGTGGDGAIDLGTMTEQLTEGNGETDAKAPCNEVATKTLSLMGSSATEALCGMGASRNGGTGNACLQGGSSDFTFSKSSDDWSADAWTAWFAKAWYGESVSKDSTSFWTSHLSDGMKYYIYYTIFKKTCGNGKNGGLNPSAWDDSNGTANPKDGTVSSTAYRLPWLNGDAIEDDYVASSQNSSSTKIKALDSSLSGDTHNHNILSSDLSAAAGSSGPNPRCSEVAAGMIKYAPAYTTEAAANVNTTNPVGGEGSTESGAIDTTCASFTLKSVFSLSWVICPLIATATSAANGLENVIAGMLCINESEIFDADMTCSGDKGSSQSSEAFHNAWNVFRVMSLGLLAIGGLVMIFSQALGFELFDAYTIKKTLPRILVAAIGITLSWQLLQFMVTFSNALGIGVRSLIYTPFTSSGIDDVVMRGGSGALGILFAGGGWAVLGPLGLLSFIATGLLAILVAFFLLIIRNILVIMLILVAPVAIAAYILPNTEKYWKLWWDWFFKALLAFPIITAIIAIGHVFAAITSQKSTGSSTLNSVVAFVAYFAPYFLIPAAFRLAGGALGTIGGFVNDRSRGGFDRLKKFRKGQSERRMAYFGNKYGNRVMQARAEMVRGLNASASKDGRTRLGSSALRFAGRQVGGLGDIEERMSAIQAAASKRANDTIATGKDDAYRGLTVNKDLLKNDNFQAELARSQAAADAGDSKNELVRLKDGKRQFKSLGGGWVDQADVQNAHREYAGDVGAQQAALSYEMRKAMDNGQVEGLSERFQSTADAWGMTGKQRAGAWIGAGFENQNQHLEYKHTKFNDNGSSYVDYDGMAKEAYEKKGSYPLSQMSGHTIEQLTQGHKQATNERATAQAARDAATASGNTEEAAKQQRVMVEKQETMDRIKGVSETFMHELGSMPAGKDGDLVPTGEDGRPGRRKVNANGAAAVNEAVYRLAEQTDVIRRAPDNPQSPGSPQTNP